MSETSTNNPNGQITYPRVMLTIIEQTQAENSQLREDLATWKQLAEDLAYSEHDEHSHLPSRIESPCERCEAIRAWQSQINHEANP